MARLPGVLSFLGMAGLLFAAVRRYVDGKVALLAALFFLTSADLLFYGTVNSGEIDLLFSFLVMAQVLAIFHFRQRKRWLMLFLVSYVLAAIGFLTKGPSIIFQLLTLGALFAYHKEWKRLFSWQHLVGLLVRKPIAANT